MTEDNKFYGKYRGTVSNNKDPLMVGRICAKVPDVLGDKESTWALPCMPFGGKGMGFFAIPSEGAGVWIEFEQGDLDYPIWSGCWWDSSSEIPTDLMTPPYQKLMIVTEGGQSITLDDTSGVEGIKLETFGGQKIVVTATGIEINNGNGAVIKLSGNQVTINNGALEVT